MLPKEHRDITTTLPLLPGCRAILWDGAVALYDAQGHCIAYEGLHPANRRRPTGWSGGSAWDGGSWSATGGPREARQHERPFRPCQIANSADFAACFRALRFLQSGKAGKGETVISSVWRTGCRGGPWRWPGPPEDDSFILTLLSVRPVDASRQRTSRRRPRGPPGLLATSPDTPAPLLPAFPTPILGLMMAWALITTSRQTAHAPSRLPRRFHLEAVGVALASVWWAARFRSVRPQREQRGTPMPLDSSQQLYVRQWTQAKFGRLVCPLCQGTGWDAGEFTAALPAGTGQMPVPGPDTHALRLTCQNCGNMLLFAPQVVGLPAGSGP